MKNYEVHVKVNWSVDASPKFTFDYSDLVDATIDNLSLDDRAFLRHRIEGRAIRSLFDKLRIVGIGERLVNLCIFDVYYSTVGKNNRFMF